MGLKMRGAFRCGRCGKPRGITHTCVTSRPRRGRTRVRSPVAWTCARCGRPRGLSHTCRVRTDFKKRRRQQARRKAAEQRKARRRRAASDRRARERARKARARQRPPRPRPPAHDYHACGDGDCARYGCTAYREGKEDGFGAGYAAAQAEGGGE
jgi:hypothetical protein